MIGNRDGYAEVAQLLDLSDALSGQFPDRPLHRPTSQRNRLALDIDALPGMDLDALRTHYRQLHRRAAPAHLPRWLLVRIVAYRMQALAHGDLDPETIRILERVARDQARAMSAENRNGAASGAKRSRAATLESGVAAVPYRLRPGTQLVREHGGELHRVIVLEKGFSWNGSAFTSLSEIARTITGTSWNGPAFFGLRSKKALSGLTGADAPVASGALP
jgi:Protein of unknown function (DUF2924)